MRAPERIGKSLEAIVAVMNSISIEELDYILKDISRSETIGPMTDPTAWQGGRKFEEARQTRKVMLAIKAFKVEVSGVGNFAKLP